MTRFEAPHGCFLALVEYLIAVFPFLAWLLRRLCTVMGKTTVKRDQGLERPSSSPHFRCRCFLSKIMFVGQAAAINQLGMAEWSNVVLVDMNLGKS